MNKTVFAIFCAAAVMSPSIPAATIRAATETFVTNKIADAIATLPSPDYSTTNAELVATIKATAPAPGNYAAVSNAAMNAVQPSVATNIAESTAASATNALDVSLSSRLSVLSRSSTNYTDAAIAAASTNYATRAELEAGWWSEWTILRNGVDVTAQVPKPTYRDDVNGWNIEPSHIAADMSDSVDAMEPEDALSLSWEAYSVDTGTLIPYTATRHRVAAPVPTKASDIGAASTNDLSAVAFTGDYNDLDNTPTIPTTAAQIGAYSAENGATLAAQVSAIGAHLNAEDAHFVSTNYDSIVHVPEAYVEVKLTDADTGSNTWVTIWREMTRWGKFVGSAFDWNTWTGFHDWATNVTYELSCKADRAWGAYDSETGGYSPEGYTQISSSNILIAAGMAYQRTITSGGAVWILQCNQGTAHVGGDTNGFFRIVDGDGNTQFEIIKGDRQELGCDADGISVGSGSPPMVTIPYSIEATEHPTLMICDNLATVNWKAETDNDCIANVSWSGTSGGYVATVQRKAAGNGAMFVKASYMAGAETYIKNNAPVGMDSIILSGTKYYLGTATISGHTVLTLSTTAP